MIPLFTRWEFEQFDLTGEELTLIQMMGSGFPYLTGGEQRTEFQATPRWLGSTKKFCDQSMFEIFFLLSCQQKREYSVIRLLFGYLHHSENWT